MSWSPRPADDDSDKNVFITLLDPSKIAAVFSSDNRKAPAKIYRQRFSDPDLMFSMAKSKTGRWRGIGGRHG